MVIYVIYIYGYHIWSEVPLHAKEDDDMEVKGHPRPSKVSYLTIPYSFQALSEKLLIQIWDNQAINKDQSSNVAKCV